MFQQKYVKNRRWITVYTQLHLTHKDSYMFRLYICSHHQADYKTLQETVKYNKLKLWGRDSFFTSVYSYTKLFKSIWKYVKVAGGLYIIYTCISIVLSLHRAFWYSHSSFTNRCTFIKTLITIYIKIRWLLHVSVYDHHQGAWNWARLKLYWY